MTFTYFYKLHYIKNIYFRESLLSRLEELEDIFNASKGYFLSNLIIKHNTPRPSKMVRIICLCTKGWTDMCVVLQHLIRTILEGQPGIQRNLTLFL